MGKWKEKPNREKMYGRQTYIFDYVREISYRLVNSDSIKTYEQFEEEIIKYTFSEYVAMHVQHQRVSGDYRKIGKDIAKWTWERMRREKENE